MTCQCPRAPLDEIERRARAVGKIFGAPESPFSHNDMLHSIALYLASEAHHCDNHEQSLVLIATLMERVQLYYGALRRERGGLQ